MKRLGSDLASVISRALIYGSKQSIPPRKWSPALEQILHQLRCRESLSPQLVARVIDPFLLNHHSLALGFFNWASQQPGFSHDSATYESILKSISVSRQFNVLDKLLKQAKSLNICLHHSVYPSIISSLLIDKKSHIAFSVFNDIRPIVSLIGPRTCNSLLAGLSSDNNFTFARRVFDEMMQRSICFNTLGVGLFLSRFCQMQELSKTLYQLDEVRRIGFSGINGSIVALLVVHGLCSANKVPDALWALDELRKRDCKPDFMAYRVVAESLRRIGCVVDVENVLKKKRKLGVAPRAKDYEDFILVLVSERLFQEATDLAEVVVSGNFPIADNVLNALIGSASSADPSCNLNFLRFMLSKDGCPELPSLVNLGENLIKHGKIGELLQIYDILSARDYFKDSKHFNAILSVLCNGGLVKEAYEVLKQMKRKGISPDVSSYNYLLEACCREDLLRPAKRLWDEMFANGCCGNLKSYKILIVKCSEVGEVQEAYRLLWHMIERGVLPDLETFSALIEGLCQESDLEKAILVFNKSRTQDKELGQSLLSKFVLFLCKKGCYVLACKLVYDNSNAEACLDSHVTLLRFLADAGEFTLAVDHIKWIGGRWPLMLHALRNEVLASLSSSSKSDVIKRLFQDPGKS